MTNELRITLDKIMKAIEAGAGELRVLNMITAVGGGYMFTVIHGNIESGDYKQYDVVCLPRPKEM